MHASKLMPSLVFFKNFSKSLRILGPKDKCRVVNKMEKCRVSSHSDRKAKCRFVSNSEANMTAEQKKCQYNIASLPCQKFAKIEVLLFGE